MKSFALLLLCTFPCLPDLSAVEPAPTQARPAPRKPFVSKSGGTAPRPLPSSPTASNVHTPPTSTAPQTKSGQAEIITITRTHKAPSLRPAVDGQNDAAPATPQENTATIGTGANAQVGKIFDRK